MVLERKFTYIVSLSGFALEKGIHINADNFQELDVIAEELENTNWYVCIGHITLAPVLKNP